MRRSGTRPIMCAHFVANLFAILLAAAVLEGAAPGEETLASLRSQFQQQTDPVKRAKSFHKLGAALLAEMRRQEAEKQYDRVLPLFLEYRDSATAAFSALSAAGRDAEKHPAGFRELEIHLRHSLHQLNDIVFGMPLDDREPLRGPQHDIEELDNRLVKALFPRGPQAHRTPPSVAKLHPEG